jgi:glutamate-1-semialdehyde 2,1-aminomutase
MNFDASNKLKEKSHSIIPGGAHTYAKGDDQYPILAPGFVVRGQGCHVWDLDGNEFIEYGMGLRSVALGHGYKPVIEAAYKQMLAGINFTRPSPIEVECAEMLLSLVSGADMVKFGKNGSDVTTAAVKIARAYTGRDLVAICSDQPFFSTDDWFIGTTAMSAGIPQAIRDLTVAFRYNDSASLEKLFNEHPGKIACVILEAAASIEPQNGYLEDVQRLCREHGAVFVLDEMITGFRWHLGGAQAYYGVVPDLSTFGKAIGNGFSVSALVGKREIMELGGLFHDHDRVFLLSQTHGAENHALAAALKTMEIYREEDVVGHLWRKGEALTDGINRLARQLGVEEYFQVVGKPCNLVYATRDREKKPSQVFRALFLQETIKRGLLMPSLVISFSHTQSDIERTIEAIGESLEVYAKALREGPERYLTGRPVKPVFRRFN